MSDAERAGVRLLELLKCVEAGEQVEIRDEMPIDQIAEACADGSTIPVQEWINVLRHNAQGSVEASVRRFGNIGLLLPGRLQTLPVNRWPPRLVMWLRHVKAAEQREGDERQATEVKRSAEEAAKRQAIVDSEAERVAQAKAEKFERELEAILKYQSMEGKRALAVERESHDRLADVLVERIRGAAVTPDGTSAHHTRTEVRASPSVAAGAPPKRYKALDDDTEVRVAEMKHLLVDHGFNRVHVDAKFHHANESEWLGHCRSRHGYVWRKTTLLAFERCSGLPRDPTRDKGGTSRKSVD